jgi:hypothetical protein
MRAYHRAATAAPRASVAAAALLSAVLAMAVGCRAQNTTASAMPPGTNVDVTPTVTSQVPERFGTQPGARSGQTLVRRLLSPPPRALLLSPSRFARLRSQTLHP